ncbi:hypothetical protein DRO69_11495 [Candidatus Bathyarchaeota archaeon]|nr:MAG: hypothetical protein DRO69_11495 [Candidatus Bathyarchaeota archaeon]
MLITPSHCRQVSIIETRQDILNNEGALKKLALNKEVYETTQYLLVGNEKQGFAILEVKKEDARKLFQRIIKVNVLALASESTLIVDSNVDVLNPNQLVPLALKTYQRSGKKATVVLGKYSHVSFVLVKGEPQLDKIEVVDVVPPRPAKLVTMIKDAMKVGLINKTVDIEVREIDLIELAKKIIDKGAEVIIFPCKSSGITAQSVGAEVFFLDKGILPVLEKGYKRLGLVGCDVSFAVLQHLLGRNFDRSKIIFEQICPRKAVPNKLPFITKCCKLREGYKTILKGETLGVIVPWGARLKEVSGALNWLLHEMAEKAKNLDVPL